MPISPARKTAYEVLRRVESGRGFAVELLQREEVGRLKEADRHLATELVMGVLRWRGELDHQLERLSRKSLEYFDPEVATALRLGIYQIRFLEKVPKAAVVNEAVEMTKRARKRSAAGLVNALLRKCPGGAQGLIKKRFEDSDAEEREAIQRTLPAWLLERWAGVFAREGAARLAWASVRVPPVTLRVAAGAGEREAVQKELLEEGIRTRRGQFGASALVVEAGSVQNSKALRQGRIVIQDEASQLVAELVAPREGQRILDVCAAPGVKTGQMAQALGRGAILACDVSARRMATMRRLLRGKVPAEVAVYLLEHDATASLPLSLPFDRILLDAPCSGTGTLARNPEIKWRLAAADLTRLAETQSRMLRNALSVLAADGRLVYATCSLEPEENEQVVEKVLREVEGFRKLGAEELAQEFPALSPLFDSRGYFRTRPDLHGMDGFFAAVVVSEG